MIVWHVLAAVVVIALFLALYYNVEKKNELEQSNVWLEDRVADLEQRLGEAHRELNKYG